MPRKYGDEQRDVEKKILYDLISNLETTYLVAFNSLNDSGLGSGSITQLTQSFLLSRDAGLTVLRNKLNCIK